MADITTLAEFITHIAAGGSHRLFRNTDVGSDGDYGIASLLTVGNGLVVTAQEPVKIKRDGSGLRHHSREAVWIGTPDCRINFDWAGQGLHGMYVRADSGGDGIYQFDYCDFTGSPANNGFALLPNNVYECHATLNHCRSMGNANDGYSIVLTAHDANTSLTLNSCSAFNNGLSNSDQALTLHNNTGNGIDTVTILNSILEGGVGMYLAGKFAVSVTSSKLIGKTTYGLQVGGDAVGSVGFFDTNVIRGAVRDIHMTQTGVVTLGADKIATIGAIGSARRVGVMDAGDVV